MALLLGTHRDVSADQSVASRAGDIVEHMKGFPDSREAFHMF
jgi:hypothetical protein